MSEELGCRRAAKPRDPLEGRCESCDHKPLQHTDRGEVIEGYGYCTVCATAAILRRILA